MRGTRVGVLFCYGLQGFGGCLNVCGGGELGVIDAADDALLVDDICDSSGQQA